MTKTLTALFLFLTLALPALAVEDGNAMYVGGTAASLKEGTLGKFDTKSPAELSFEFSGSRLVIPFAKIDSYEVSERVAHHLGVLPAITVGLLKQRRKRHFLRIAYHDESSTPQVAIFEIPKKMPLTLLPILQQRAPQGCKPRAFEKCTVQE